MKAAKKPTLVAAIMAATLTTGSLADVAVADTPPAAPLTTTAAASSMAGSATTATRTPGTLTRVTELPEVARLPGAAVAKRIAYWTRTSRNKPALSTAALFIPTGATPKNGWPVLVWEHGTTGLADACAPSVSGSAYYRDYLTTLLSQGYAIVATDYIGLGTPGVHAYMDGKAEAHAAIDALRAGRTLKVSLSPRWATIGHSQGGQAALFTASLATRYAPDLDYRGTVVLAPGVDAVDTLLAAVRPGIPDAVPANRKPYIVYALRGLKAARPEFNLNSYLTPLGKKVIADAERLCLSDMDNRMKTVRLSQLVSRPLAQGKFEAIARPVWDIPQTGYDRPFLIAQGLRDTDVSVPAVAKLARDLKAHGVKFTTRTYPGIDHHALLTDSAKDVDPYLARLLR